MTGTQLATAILRELDALGKGQTADADDCVDILARVNRMLDAWNAKYGPAYAETVYTGTLTPSKSPHTIGPSGCDLTATVRPVSILSATIISGTTRYPLAPTDRATWDKRPDASTSTLPTDFFYNPAWPNGEIYLWEIPAAGYTLEVVARTLLSALTLSGTFSMPPGYEDAVIKSAVEECAGRFGRDVTLGMKQAASDARAVIRDANSTIPRLATRDYGMPGGSGRGDIRAGR